MRLRIMETMLFAMKCDLRAFRGSGLFIQNGVVITSFIVVRYGANVRDSS